VLGSTMPIPRLSAAASNESRCKSDWAPSAVTIGALVGQQGAWANIPPKRNRKEPICFSPYLYRARNLTRVRNLARPRSVFIY